MVRAIIPEGRTARLLLRPLELADAPQIQRLFPQWNVVKYLSAKLPWPYPPDGAEQFIRSHALPQMELGQEWHWTIRLLADPDSVIGAIGLFLSENENRGFWLAPEHRGHGYITEACAWANEFWFETLGQPILRAPKAAANRASRRLSERMGMRLARLDLRDFVSGRLPSEIWEITAEEWRAWKLLHPIVTDSSPSPHSNRKPRSPASKRSSPERGRL